jgi:hypothetical protein
MKTVLAASICALRRARQPAIAAVGDIVALVRAERVAANAGAGLNAGGSRRLVPDAHLATTLSGLGFAGVTALGAATDNGPPADAPRAALAHRGRGRRGGRPPRRACAGRTRRRPSRPPPTAR